MAGAVLAATGAYERSQWSEQRGAKSALSRLQQIRARHERLESDNARLKGELDSMDSKATLEGRIREFAALRSYYDRLQLEERRLRATLKLPDGPLWPDNSVVRPASEWAYAGQATPAATVESVLAVARSGDIDRLASLIAFETAAKAEAAATFNQLPDASKAEYGTPEKVMATLIAGQMPTSYAAMAVIDSSNPDPNSAVVKVRMENGDGSQSDVDFKLQQSQGAWRLDVPVQEVAALGFRLNGPGAR